MSLNNVCAGYNVFDNPYKMNRRIEVSFFEGLTDLTGDNSYEGLLKDLTKHNMMSIFDAGCGDGRLIKYLQTLPIEIDYLGIDISKNAIDQAKKAFPEQKFEQADLSKIKLASNSQDVAIAHMVFALIENVEPCLSEVARVLKVGGEFRIFTPAYWRQQENEPALKFQLCMDFLKGISPDPDDVGVGNLIFRSDLLIRNALLKAFGHDVEISFESHDFVIEKSPLSCLTLFSEGMYQFFMIPNESKGQALKDMFDKILSLTDADGTVRMKRTMEIIKVTKS
jgi:SAM-dependent methyltransferase